MADKLKRFLILGSVSSTYIACHRRVISEEMPELPGLDQLVSESKEEEVVQILVKAAGDVRSGLTDPVLLAHATSLCIKSDSIRLRKLTYQALTSICLTSDGLFRVLEAIRKVARTGPKKVGMWGKGLRKALKRWYALRISQGEEDFASMFISEKACYSWTHRDVLKLIHFRAPTPQVDAIIKYFAFGKSECLSQLSPALQNIATKVDELKKCQDGSRAAALLTELKIHPFAMPAKFHKNPEVWAAYLHNLPLRKILNRLEFLTTIKDFNANELFSRLDKADPEDLDAGEIMMYLAQYNACRFNATKRRAIKRKRAEITLQQASGFVEGVKKPKADLPPVVANPSIVTAVNGILTSCLDKIPNDNRVWSFLLDMKKEETKCSYPYFLPTVDAAVYSMQYLQRTGPVFYLANDAVHPCPKLPSEIRNALLASEKKFDLTAAHTNIVSSNTDVVVFISDSKNLKTSSVEAIMTTLRKNANKPEMRLVILLLCGNRNYNVDDKTLVVCGWDERSLRLINHFAKGDF